VENLKKVFTTGGLKKSLLYAVDDVSFSIAQGEDPGTGGGERMWQINPGQGSFDVDSALCGEGFFIKMKRLRLQPASASSKFVPKCRLFFQHPESALNPRLKIYESLTEPMRVQGIVKNRKDEKEKAPLSLLIL
jgi:ABC-type dipeptide/oligopeptide/nickel transport system ATPase subunit